jgi:hypothetical protein
MFNYGRDSSGAVCRRAASSNKELNSDVINHARWLSCWRHA